MAPWKLPTGIYLEEEIPRKFSSSWKRTFKTNILRIPWLNSSREKAQT